MRLPWLQGLMSSPENIVRNGTVAPAYVRQVLRRPLQTRREMQNMRWWGDAIIKVFSEEHFNVVVHSMNISRCRQQLFVCMTCRHVSFTFIVIYVQYVAFSSVSTGGAMYNIKVFAKMAVVLAHLRRCLTYSLTVKVFSTFADQEDVYNRRQSI